MKRTINILLVLGILFLLTFCKKDDEPIPIPTAADFVGNYRVSETCNGNTDAYDIIVSLGSNSTSVRVDNLYDISSFINFDGTIPATINNGELVITDFTLTSGDDNFIIFNGNGTLSGDVLTINFTYEEKLGNTPASASTIFFTNCVAICTRN